jgi:predicted phosphodiesterase
MKYVVFGDIHGNLEAYDAVVEAFQVEKPDATFCLGDVVGYGADPSACIAQTRKLGCKVVAGNHDFAAIDKVNVDFFNTFAREAALWTRKMLSDDEKAFLSGLKLVESAPGITLVHSTLNSPELFEYIQTSYDAHLSFQYQNTPVCFVGHSHVPVVFTKKHTVSFTMDTTIEVDPKAKTMINVGSVGQPRDENPDSSYAVYDVDRQTIQIKRVRYDVEKAARKILKAGLPEILAERLRYGR